MIIISVSDKRKETQTGVDRKVKLEPNLSQPVLLRHQAFNGDFYSSPSAEATIRRDTNVDHLFRGILAVVGGSMLLFRGLLETAVMVGVTIFLAHHFCDRSKRGKPLLYREPLLLHAS